jgi:hypothetical protein
MPRYDSRPKHTNQRSTLTWDHFHLNNPLARPRNLGGCGDQSAALIRFQEPIAIPTCHVTLSLLARKRVCQGDNFDSFGVGVLY